ncbi:MAG: hydrogenase iron-sulfur subunit [Deltaproteobacteria bacterium]|nr:hydrogenase iron-sulfur subunit [Deltaproteobacteria bacterium]
MSDYKIILFCCNWGPHAAFLNLQDRREEIPNEIKMVRIPCSGRITKALLFKAFEMGADGVILLGCESGSCRYGSGTATAMKNTTETREILALLGLGERRLRLENFLPHQSDELLAFLKGFVAGIKEIGKSPIFATGSLWEDRKEPETPEEIIAAHDVYSCQDCGKCTSACPLALAGKPFSPRAVANDIIAGRADTKEVIASVNACLTCGVCYERCPSAVNFPEFIKDMRAYYRRRNMTTEPAHGGFFQSMMRAMTSEGLKPDRWKNLPENIKINKNSKILFFGGCAPYFDVFFRVYLKINTSSILEDSIKLLNFFDIEPNVLEKERCCGHDLLWSGDRDNFIKLARLNLKAIEESGAEEVITACPECYHTLLNEYKHYGIELPVKITHIHEFLDKEVEKGAVGFKPLETRVSFQDSCRQSRFNNLADLPRKLIEKFAQGNIDESSARSLTNCCGNSAWTGCDSFSKAMQVQRLKQARNSGSGILITACPKCQIHLRCAMEDALRGDELKMEMMDLTTAIAKTIYWE